MFGFLSRAKPRASFEKSSPRVDAITNARSALESSARYLTSALREIDVDCAQLAGIGPLSSTSASSLLDDALVYDDHGRRVMLMLGKTSDFHTFNLEPHYRYREIHLVVSDLERLERGDVHARLQLVRQHASHALIQSRMLMYFLLRAGVVERLREAGDMKTIKREMEDLVEALTGLTAQLPDTFARGLDLADIRREWVEWPYIDVEPVSGQVS